MCEHKGLNLMLVNWLALLFDLVEKDSFDNSIVAWFSFCAGNSLDQFWRGKVSSSLYSADC